MKSGQCDSGCPSAAPPPAGGDGRVVRPLYMYVYWRMRVTEGRSAWWYQALPAALDPGKLLRVTIDELETFADEVTLGNPRNDSLNGFALGNISGNPKKAGESLPPVPPQCNWGVRSIVPRRSYTPTTSKKLSPVEVLPGSYNNTFVHCHRGDHQLQLGSCHPMKSSARLSLRSPRAG